MIIDQINDIFVNIFGVVRQPNSVPTWGKNLVPCILTLLPLQSKKHSSKSASIGGAKKLYCYFQHHQTPKCSYIGGAKVIFLGSTTTVHDQKQLCIVTHMVKKTKKKKKNVVFTLFFNKKNLFWLCSLCFLMKFLYYFNQIAKNIDLLIFDVL